jgi:polysaccharide export outer membrane protein
MVGLFRIAALLGLAVLAGCRSLPAAGPTSAAFNTQAAEHVGPATGRAAPGFVLVDLDERAGAVLLRHHTRPAVGGLPSRRGTPDIRIGVGDVVSLAIFEAESGGLFTPKGNSSQGNFVRIPDQEVDRAGDIKVPFLGEVKVAGRNPSEVERDIESALANRAIEPQAVVTVSQRNSARFTVVGAVRGPGVFPFSQSGERILDAIGQAGGITDLPQNTLVTLQSGGRQTTVAMNALFERPANNVNLQPGDTVVVAADQRVFTVFGAAARNGQVLFDKPEITLAEGLAQVGGLIDAAADSRSVVIYRFMRRGEIAELGATLAGFPPDQQVFPVVLRLDLGSAGGYFLARAVYIEPGDLLYVSNAPLYDFTKLTAVVRDISATVTDTADAGRSLH